MAGAVWLKGRGYATPSTSRSVPLHGMLGAGGALAVQRLPTDPIYLADVILDGVVPGSRYWLADADDLSRVLATGVADTNPYTIANVPAYGNPFRIEIRIRNASSSPYYKPLTTYVFHAKEGVRVFIQQVLDE